MVLYPGDVVVVKHSRAGVRGVVHYVCIDFHFGLYLLALNDPPFHNSFVHIGAGQENWLTTDLYIHTNILQQLSLPPSGIHLGMLGKYSKSMIVRCAEAEKALLLEEKRIIMERLTGEPDVFYHDVDEDLD